VGFPYSGTDLKSWKGLYSKYVVGFPYSGTDLKSWKGLYSKYVVGFPYSGTDLKSWKGLYSKYVVGFPYSGTELKSWKGLYSKICSGFCLGLWVGRTHGKKDKKVYIDGVNEVTEVVEWLVECVVWWPQEQFSCSGPRTS
jgi:hypothetical protein